MENQKKVWNIIAPSWNTYRHKVSPTAYNFLKEVKGTVLDMGCGSGRNFVQEEGLNWYGIDFSEEMIRLAEENAKQKGVFVQLCVMDVTKLTFKDHFFDAVLCFSVLHCIPSQAQRRKALQEVYRVLKPQGKALISVWGKQSPRTRAKKKEDEIPWTEKGVTRYNYTYDLEELQEEIHSAGFKILHIWEERNVNAIVFKP